VIPGDVIGGHYANEAVLHQSPVSLVPAAAATAGGTVWKSHCDDAVMTSYHQLPQYYPSTHGYNAVAAVPCGVMWPVTHCKTSARRRNSQRHRDHVCHSTAVFSRNSSFTFVTLCD